MWHGAFICQCLCGRKGGLGAKGICTVGGSVWGLSTGYQKWVKGKFRMLHLPFDPFAELLPAPRCVDLFAKHQIKIGTLLGAYPGRGWMGRSTGQRVLWFEAGDKTSPKTPHMNSSLWGFLRASVIPRFLGLSEAWKRWPWSTAQSCIVRDKLYHVPHSGLAKTGEWMVSELEFPIPGAFGLTTLSSN